MIIKILSYNIHKGYDWKNQKYFLKEMKDFIIKNGADVVCLQEVVGKNSKNQDMGLIDSQLEFLADEIWPHFSYGHNAVYDHGHHGNMILSKYPIESFENIDLSTNIFEKRGLLICKITLPIKADNQSPFFYTACSHLNLLHSGRVVQYQKIKNFLLLNSEILAGPLVIAGDFNDWNKQSSDVFERELSMQEVYKSTHGYFAKSFPSIYPLFCLDRIYVKNLTIKKSNLLKTNNEQTLFSQLSDHLPLYCEVEVNG